MNQVRSEHTVDVKVIIVEEDPIAMAIRSNSIDRIGDAVQCSAVQCSVIRCKVVMR